MSDGSDVVGALDALPNSDGEVSVEAIVIGIHKFVFDQSFAEFFPPKSRQMYAFECTLTDGLSTMAVLLHPSMNSSVERGSITRNTTLEIKSVRRIKYLASDRSTTVVCVITEAAVLPALGVARRSIPAAATARADGSDMTQPMMVQRGKFLPLFVDDDFSSMPWWNQVTQESLEPIAEGFALPGSAPSIADCLSMALGNAPGKRIGASSSSVPALQEGETLSSEGLKPGGRFGRETPYARLIAANRNAPVLFGRLAAVSRVTCYARPSTSTDWPFKFHFVLQDGSSTIKVVVWNAQAAKLHQALSGTPHGTILALTGYRVKEWHGQVEVALNTNPPSNVFVVPDSSVCTAPAQAEGAPAADTASATAQQADAGAGDTPSPPRTRTRGRKRGRGGRSTKNTASASDAGASAEAQHSAAARKAVKVRAMLQKLGMWKGGQTVVLESVLDEIELDGPADTDSSAALSGEGATAAATSSGDSDSDSDSGQRSTSLFALQGGKLVLNTPSAEHEPRPSPRARKAARRGAQASQDVSQGVPTAAPEGGAPPSAGVSSAGASSSSSSGALPPSSEEAGAAPSQAGVDSIQAQIDADLARVLPAKGRGGAAAPAPPRVVTATQTNEDGTPFDPLAVEAMSPEQAAERFPLLPLQLRTIGSVQSAPPSSAAAGGQDEVSREALPLFSVAGKVLSASTVFRQSPLLSVDEASGAQNGGVSGVPAAMTAPGPWQAYRWVDLQDAHGGTILRVKVACNSAADAFLSLAPGQCVCITRVCLVAQAPEGGDHGESDPPSTGFACMTPESQLLHTDALRSLLEGRQAAGKALGLNTLALPEHTVATTATAGDSSTSSAGSNTQAHALTPVAAALSPRKTRSGRVVGPPSTSTRGGGSKRARRAQATAKARQEQQEEQAEHASQLQAQETNARFVPSEEDVLLLRVLGLAEAVLSPAVPLPASESSPPASDAEGGVVETTLGSLVEHAAEALDVIDSERGEGAVRAAAVYERVASVALCMGVQLPPPNAARYAGALGELVDLLAMHAAALWGHWGFYSGGGRDHGRIMLQGGRVVELKQDTADNQAAPFTGPAAATATSDLLRVPVEVLRGLAAAEEACESLDTPAMAALAALADRLAWQPSPPQGGTEAEQQQWWAVQHELAVVGQALAPVFRAGGANRPGGVLFSRQRLADGHLQLAPPRELLNLPFPHGGPTAQHAFLEAQRAFLRGVLPAVRSVAALHAAAAAAPFSSASSGALVGPLPPLSRPFSLQRLVALACCAPVLSTFLEHEHRVEHGGSPPPVPSDEAKARFAAVAGLDIGSLGMSRGDHSTATGIPLVTPEQLAQILDASPLAVGERRRVLVRARLVGLHAPPGETVGVSFQLSQTGSASAATATSTRNASSASVTPLRRAPPHNALASESPAESQDGSLPPTQIDPDAETDSEDEHSTSENAPSDASPAPPASSGGFLAGVVSFLSGANSSLWGALRATAPPSAGAAGGASAASASATPVQKPAPSTPAALASPTLGVSRRTRGARMQAAAAAPAPAPAASQQTAEDGAKNTASLAVGSDEQLNTVFVTGFGQCGALTPLAASAAIADGCGFATLSGGVSLLVPPHAPFPRPQAALLKVLSCSGDSPVPPVLPPSVPYSPVLTLDAVDLGVHYSLTPEGEPEGGVGALQLEDAVVPASRVCLQTPAAAGADANQSAASTAAGTPVLSVVPTALAPVRVSAAAVPSFAHHLLHFLPERVLAQAVEGGGQGGQGGLSLLRLAHTCNMFENNQSDQAAEMVFCVQLVQCGAGRGSVAYLDAAFEL